MAAAGHRVVAVDPSSIMINYARQRRVRMRWN
nr:class I SAM-dependent methyltransferase [Paraburkholderia graminis]